MKSAHRIYLVSNVFLFLFKEVVPVLRIKFKNVNEHMFQPSNTPIELLVCIVTNMECDIIQQAKPTFCAKYCIKQNGIWTMLYGGGR